MRHSLFNPAPSAALKSALERFESGFFNQAAMQLLQVMAAEPDNADARFYFKLAERKLTPRPMARPTLVWQFDPAQAWESDWLRGLLKDVIGGEVIDRRWAHIADPMIVVDNRLVPEKISYYREAFEKNARVILVHLSDEAFKDDLGAYKYCDGVVRNYYSERLAQFRDIFFLPLGAKQGFGAASQPKPVGHRKYIWSFAGDGKKLTRADMLREMGAVADGWSHLTAGFGAADALPTADYRALLDDSVFVPAPSGWSNLDSFRLYEALEAGCIPIVEKRPAFDYFTILLGPHPMPAVEHWSEAAVLVRRLGRSREAEDLRQACHAWWQALKPDLTARLGAFVARTLAG